MRPPARVKLMDKFGLSQIQAQAILDMRLHQLTNLESQAIEMNTKISSKPLPA